MNAGEVVVVEAVRRVGIVKRFQVPAGAGRPPERPQKNTKKKNKTATNSTHLFFLPGLLLNRSDEPKTGLLPCSAAEREFQLLVLCKAVLGN